MITQCPYCSLDTAGNHASSCPGLGKPMPTYSREDMGKVLDLALLAVRRAVLPPLERDDILPVLRFTPCRHATPASRCDECIADALLALLRERLKG